MDKYVDFTVAIPTYNGETRLPELLQKLQNQLHIDNISWEIIVVDNNSTDNTAKIIKELQANWKYPFNLRYYLETKQGAAHARKRAVAEAKGNLIGFLDDDNYPDLNWVSAAYNFAQKYPNAGTYGSQIHPNWEIEPPQNFQRIAPFLAITERGDIPLIYPKNSKFLPPSAGLVVRKEAWLECVPDDCILTGRANGSMLTGEDTELLCYIQNSDWEIWYNPEMEIYHQIPSWRLKKEYLIPFFRGIGLSRYVTRMTGINQWMIPIMSIIYMINDIKKIFIQIIKYRFGVKNDLVSACEMELYCSSLISPFYLWSNGYFSHKNESDNMQPNRNQSLNI
jgi:glycosyltransferase involved in cell wall biosynthesis